MAVVTLTTDFGTGDFEVGVLRGVILKIAPGTKIADLSHEIRRHDVLEAALLLGRLTPYFPEGSIHVVVVDPGVGTERRPIAARLGSQFFVGPDNGVMTAMLERAERNAGPVEIVHADKPEYWLPNPSDIFHGRDVFSPVGGHLAAGVPLAELGSPVDDPVRIEIPRPERIPGGWRSPITGVDHFGNLTTALRMEHLRSLGEVIVRVGRQEIHGLVKTFGERPSGELVALFNSTGNLDISVVNGNAARLLGVGAGDPVEVISRVEGSASGIQ